MREEGGEAIVGLIFAGEITADPRKLFKIGVCFSSEERGVSEWKIA